jgi:hypothetical protein
VKMEVGVCVWRLKMGERRGLGRRMLLRDGGGRRRSLLMCLMRRGSVLMPM